MHLCGSHLNAYVCEWDCLTSGKSVFTGCYWYTCESGRGEAPGTTWTACDRDIYSYPIKKKDVRECSIKISKEYMISGILTHILTRKDVKRIKMDFGL